MTSTTNEQGYLGDQILMAYETRNPFFLVKFVSDTISMIGYKASEMTNSNPVRVPTFFFFVPMGMGVVAYKQGLHIFENVIPMTKTRIKKSIVGFDVSGNIDDERRRRNGLEFKSRKYLLDEMTRIEGRIEVEKGEIVTNTSMSKDCSLAVKRFTLSNSLVSKRDQINTLLLASEEFDNKVAISKVKVHKFSKYLSNLKHALHITDCEEIGRKKIMDLSK